MLTLHGVPTSTFCTTCRMVLAIKGVTDFTLDPNVPHSAEQDRHHPWGKVPAMTHDGFTLFETAAITAYLDDVLPGPALQPKVARDRARMTQWISAYCDNVPKVTFPIIIERLIVPARGDIPDEERILTAAMAAPATLAVFDRALEHAPYLAGEALTLADLFLVPNMVFFRATSEGARILADLPHLRAMVDRVMADPVIAATMA
jgi:glutathione S-transferase